MKQLWKSYSGFILVLTMLGVFVWWSSAAEAETIFEVGPSQVGDSMTAGIAVTVTERFQDRYDITVGYISEQKFKPCGRTDCLWRIRPQIFAGVELKVTDPWTGNVKLGIGPYLFQNRDRVAPAHFRMGLSLEWRITDRFGLSARHWSTAGSGGYGCVHRETGELDVPDCYKGDWNTGQDSWLRFVYYTR